MSSPQEPEILRSLEARGRMAWPDFTLQPGTFAAHAEGVCRAAKVPLVDAGKLHAEDLYLACACLQRAEGAIEVFERDYLRRALLRLRKYVGSSIRSTDIDELGQDLRAELLVGISGPPRIAQYQGRASLRGWLWVVVRRAAPRSLPPWQEVPEGPEWPPGYDGLPMPDLGIHYDKTLYREMVQRAFEEAFLRLSTEQRNLLRWHFIDGLTIDHLGELLHCHRSTAARWIVAALNAVHDAVKDCLAHHLSINAAEAHSILNLVRSQLDLSIHRLLKQE